MGMMKWLNPWWVNHLSQEKLKILEDQMTRVKWSRTIMEAEACKAFRAAAAANKGAKRLHDKNVQLKNEVAALKAINRTLKHKLGEE